MQLYMYTNLSLCYVFVCHGLLDGERVCVHIGQEAARDLTGILGVLVLEQSVVQSNLK